MIAADFIHVLVMGQLRDARANDYRSILEAYNMMERAVNHARWEAYDDCTQCCLGRWCRRQSGMLRQF
jgi:hypothetical protein